MRSIWIALALLCITATSALAKPKVAIAPLRGDAKDRVAEAVREALADEYALVPKKDVARALGSLGLSGELEEGDCKKLQGKLGAAVVIQGKLGKAGKTKSVKFTVAVRGKKASDFTLKYKSPASAGFRNAVREAFAKRIGEVDENEAVAAAESDGEEKEKAKPRRRLADDDDEEKEKPKKKAADSEDEESGDDAKPKLKKRVATADDEDDESEEKVERRRGDDDDARPGAARPLPVARIDAGLSLAVRRLTYAVNADSTTPPPRVGTGAGAARIEGEIYPMALSDRKSPLARLGLIGEYDKTFGLAVTVPSTGASVPISQSHFSIGARYRLPVRSSAVAFDLRYARRQYVADRGGLAAPTDFDAPDTSYAAVVPGVGARVPVTPRVSLYGSLAAMLVLSAGSIANAENYGSASVFGLAGAAGVDIGLAKQFALRVGGEYTQLSMSFEAAGAMAMARGVTAATDRYMGLAATVAAMF